MDLGMRDRVALVTGGSRGIGRAIAAELAAEGARVAISSRTPEEAAEQLGVLGIPHDSHDLDAVPALLERVSGDLGGPVEVLVTNTGGPPGGPDPLGFARDAWEAAYRELVLHPMALVEHALPAMRSRGWGRVVNVASTSAREPIAALMLSNTHRAGTLAAWKTIARHVAGDGVTVNSVLPGRIWTDRLASLYGPRVRRGRRPRDRPRRPGRHGRGAGRRRSVPLLGARELHHRRRAARRRRPDPVRLARRAPTLGSAPPWCSGQHASLSRS
jgi:3-oxoacyl-[acyl-carrier protein] reductase